MNNLLLAINNAKDCLPESGQPEQLRETLKHVLDALTIIEQEFNNSERWQEVNKPSYPRDY
jgi:hypothetical protein